MIDFWSILEQIFMVISSLFELIFDWILGQCLNGFWIPFTVISFPISTVNFWVIELLIFSKLTTDFCSIHIGNFQSATNYW